MAFRRGGVTSRREQRSNMRALDRGASILSAVVREAYEGVNAEVALEAVGLLVENRVKKLLSQPGSGRVYGRHQASAPGEPPAVDEGRLRASYTHQLGVDRRGPYVEVGTDVEYAPHLEFGTSRMRPRPHLRPAIEQGVTELVAVIAKGMERSLRTAAAKRGGR